MEPPDIAPVDVIEAPVMLPVAVMLEVGDILCPLIFPYGAVIFPLYDCRFPYAETLPIDDVILPVLDVISPTADSVPVKEPLPSE